MAGEPSSDPWVKAMRSTTKQAKALSWVIASASCGALTLLDGHHLVVPHLPEQSRNHPRRSVAARLMSRSAFLEPQMARQGELSHFEASHVGTENLLRVSDMPGLPAALEQLLQVMMTTMHVCRI